MAQFNLDEYETVESRLKRYAEKYPDFRVKTRVIKYTENHILIEAWIYQNKEDLLSGAYHASGIAEEVRGEGFVNKTSHVENCETSAIGRSLANANFSGDKRPSREEMTKVERLSTPKTATDLGMCPKCGSPLTTRLIKGVERKVCSTNGYDRITKKSTGCPYVEWDEPTDKLPTDEYYDKSEVRNEDEVVPF